MAKYSLRFLDSIVSSDYIEVKSDVKNKLINIHTESQDLDTFISLDISTAIKFAKAVRTEINKAKEVKNV